MEAKQVGPSPEQIGDSVKKLKSEIELITKINRLTASEAGKLYVEYDMIQWGLDNYPHLMKHENFVKPSTREHQLIYDKFGAHGDDRTRQELEDFYQWYEIETAFSIKWKEARYYQTLAKYTIEFFSNVLDNATAAARVQAAGEQFKVDPAAGFGKAIFDVIQAKTLDHYYNDLDWRDAIPLSMQIFNAAMKWLNGYGKAIDIVVKKFDIEPLRIYKHVTSWDYLTRRVKGYNITHDVLAKTVDESSFSEAVKKSWHEKMEYLLPKLNPSGKEWDVTRSQVMRARNALKSPRNILRSEPGKEDFFSILGAQTDGRLQDE